jgi:hypothetical protein
LRSTEAEKAQDEHHDDDEPYEVYQLVHGTLDALNVPTVGGVSYRCSRSLFLSVRIVLLEEWKQIGDLLFVL